MSKRTQGRRRTFTAEQRAEAVRLVRQPGSSVAQVARDLGLVASCLSRWVRQAEIDEGRGPDSLTIARAMRAWLEHAHVEQPGLPKGPLMEGIRYGLNQWSTLERFLTDGRIREISNNGCERALRAVVLGRKNWLFFGSEEGTEASLILMSLVQSCREHDISPLLYLRDVLHAVSLTPASRVAELTPLGWIRGHERRARSAATTATIDAVVGGLFGGGGAG